VLAGLGVAVLPESCMTEGLKSLSVADGYPELEEIELMLFGESAERGHLMAPLLRFIEESLRPRARPRLGD